MMKALLRREAIDSIDGLNATLGYRGSWSLTSSELTLLCLVSALRWECRETLFPIRLGQELLPSKFQHGPTAVLGVAFHMTMTKRLVSSASGGGN
jgi:hypothetical protein